MFLRLLRTLLLIEASLKRIIKLAHEATDAYREFIEVTTEETEAETAAIGKLNDIEQSVSAETERMRTVLDKQ